MIESNHDIRWHQRFANFNKAYNQLERFIEKEVLNEMEEQGFQDGYINNGLDWMRMHKSRNLTSHTYDEDAVKEIIGDIRTVYFMLLKKLQMKLVEEKTRNSNHSIDG